jgi:peroxiredoxin
MTIVDEYNYETFTTSEARGRTRTFAEILHAGDEAPDFELPTVDGDRFQLSSLRGRKHVLLEFGSIT